MQTVKKTIIATLAAAAAVTALAGPAAAQGYGYERHDQGRYEQDRHDRRWDDAGNINARQAQISQRIEWGLRRGTLDRREAARLRQDAREIARLEAQYRYGGLTSAERRILDRRLDRLELAVSYEAHDRDYGRR